MKLQTVLKRILRQNAKNKKNDLALWQTKFVQGLGQLRRLTFQFYGEWRNLFDSQLGFLARSRACQCQ